MKCRMLAPAPDSPCRHYIQSEIPNEAGFCTLSSRFRCEEALKFYNPPITQSAVKSFLQCPYKYKLQYIGGIVRKPSQMPDSIKTGVLWDAYLDAKYRKGKFNPTAIIDKYEIPPPLVAKVEALVNAMKLLELKLDTQGLLGCQYQVKIPIAEHTVIGYVDRAYDDHIVESKLTSNPDFYFQPENIHMQVGTYLMTNPAWEHVIMEVVRLPSLKTGYGRFEDEDPNDYRDRIIADIVKRPSYYFPGFSRANKTFGRRFLRGEFDFDRLFSDYSKAFRLLRYTIDNDLWLRNTLACHVPAPCWYLDIKRTGGISENIYERVNVNEAKKGVR